MDNGKLKNVADLENGANKIENSLESVDKNFIKKMVKTLNSMMSIAQHKEDGIFNVILKWFRLYLKLGSIINPDDEKLSNYYEKSVPTVITYIIGCLQYKTKKVSNYHYTLLEILEELVESIQPSVLKNITKFAKGTIGCLWNPIDLAGDFNTQMKALKLLSVLIQQFDEKRQNEELKCIKWTNLNFFQEKLKKIVQETKLSDVLENCSRELLNNYNMNFNFNKAMVYSFYCKSLLLGNKYKFHKPLKIQRFWIDINYSPKTISYTGRFKLDSSLKYENISVILQIQKIILKNNTLQIYFNKPGNFSKHSDYLSNTADNVIEFTLTKEETQRLVKNYYVIDYFNDLGESSTTSYEKTDEKYKSAFDVLKSDMTITIKENKNKESRSVSHLITKSENFAKKPIPDSNIDHEKASKFFKSCRNNTRKALVDSPTTSKSLKNVMTNLPSRNIRNRKQMFTSLLMEYSDEELGTKKTKRKKSQKAKTRQSKSRSKQVCKVTPTVDLTKSEKIERLDQDCVDQSIQIQAKNNVTKNSFQLLNTEVCDEVLKQVGDIYDPCDSTYAKPCQSYRDFQLELSPIQKTCRNLNPKTGKKKTNFENESSAGKKRKLPSCYSQANKENINPQNGTVFDEHRPLPKNKSSFSPHLFETQLRENETNKYKNGIVEKMKIDLTENTMEEPISIDDNQDKEDNIFSSGSLEYEEVRGLNENYMNDIDLICTPTKTLLSNSIEATTPRLTNSMIVSNFDDSDMEITPDFNCFSPKSKICDKNDTLQDMELTQNQNLFQTDYEHSANLQINGAVLKEKVSKDMQQILNDFNYSSGDKLDLSYKLPGPSNDIISNHLENNKSADRDYNIDCIVYQNRKRNDEWSSSDEESSYDEFADIPRILKSNKTAVHNSEIMPYLPSFLNQSVCQENKLRTSRDKEATISKKCTSGIAMKCQITPTGIIMHQFEISTKKSVVLKSKNRRKFSRANKCLNNYFSNKHADNAVDIHRENSVFCSQHINNLNESNGIPLSRPTCYTRTLDKRYLKNTISNSRNDCLQKTSTKTQANPESLSTQKSIFFDSNHVNEIRKNSFPCNGFHQNIQKSDVKNSFKADILGIIEDYDSNIKLRLDNAMRLVLKSISDKYTRRFLDITKTVLKKSDEHRMELEQIRLNIGQLVRQLEWQYDSFINKSKEFDIHREVMDRVMENIMNIDVSNCIAKEYEDIIDRLNFEQKGVFQNVWQKYLDKQN